MLNLDRLITAHRDGLLEDTLPFWINHCVDREHGGFLISLDRDGSVLDTDKSVWTQCRFTWMLGELYNNLEPREDWLDLARHGIDFIEKHCFDSRDGRMWFHVTRDGRPLRKRRYAFTEAFASIAFGEYSRATGDEHAAERARQTFREFIDHHTIPGRVSPKFTDVRPMKSLGFLMLTINCAQQLRDSIELPGADGWIDRSIEEIERDFLKPDIQCVMENVGPDGERLDHFDGRILNPGHALECAWFILQEGKWRDDSHLVDLGCRMLDWMWARGWDEEHGGILYYRDVEDRPVQEYWHDMKFWWPQNEAMIATLLAYQLTRNDRYARWYTMIHDWAHEHFSDREHGEWYGYLHRDGSVSVPLKGNLWKGPFHLPRMQLICWKILEELRSKEPENPV